ncbi:SPOR domain-containing protein [Vibrio sp. CK2-1]|uniref:SPOR domain-containing protein n=1 Tax=Vibrio sp. CK2-1 TaxID=2912249 RepID=UPI001F02F2ED|nr:SPOR domain-containing protein [Vibrio sp. CK2-1]MCF7354180.1 SPOR domain-containing protein [Vibrio sp. CK2-1]
MASKFQSRLIGTVILVAIGVIVLPDVFDGQKEHYKEEFAAIPIKPTDDVSQASASQDVKKPVELDVALPEEPVTVTVDEAPKSEPIKSVTVQAEPETKPQPEVKPQPKPVVTKPAPVREKNQYSDSAWIIQLVALSNKDNAQKLVADLQKRGFQAHLKQDGKLSRVIIGPDVSKEKMEQQIDKLQEITSLKGQLQTFKPLNQ